MNSKNIFLDFIFLLIQNVCQIYTITSNFSGQKNNGTSDDECCVQTRIDILPLNSLSVFISIG